MTKDESKLHNDAPDGTCSGCMVTRSHGAEGWKVVDAGTWGVLPENGCDCTNPKCAVKLGKVKVAVVRVRRERDGAEGVVEVQFMPDVGGRTSNVQPVC